MRSRGTPADLRARVTKDRVIVSASGVSAVSIARDLLPEAARGLKIEQEGQFTINETRTPLADRPEARPVGPIKDALLAPFIFVSGTAPGAAMGDKPAQIAATDWYRFAKSPPRTASEAEITEQELGRFNVFIFGEPEHSALARRIVAGSPIEITPTEFVLAGKRFARQGAGLFFVARSPWNPEKLACLQCGTSWGRNLPSNHRYDLLPDYIVYSVESESDGSNKPLCAGFFSEEWGFDPTTMYVANP